MLMLRRALLRTLTAASLAGRLGSCRPAAVGAATADAPNAADAYRRAFAWAAGLRPEDWGRLRDATAKLDDRAVDDLLRHADAALDAIREAARIPRCDWGVATVTPDDINKGHIDPANVNLIRIACLSARRQARSGRGRQALDDAFAALTMAHRIGSGGLLIARLLESAGEASAFRTLGRILPELDRPALDDLARRLDVLPPPEPASATIGPESRFILGAIGAKLAKAGPTIDAAKWADLGFEKDQAEALQRLTGGDRDRLLAHLDATGPAFAEMARRLDLPRPAARAALDAFAESERSTQPIAAGLVESAWGVRHVVDRMNALRAMLRAGLALTRDGEPSFRRVRDPFGSGPFHLERRGNGHVIRSAPEDPGRPGLTLGIGDTA